ncbi:MAG: hypothetical protein GXO03_05155 [Aquificae bacterium]|nr:hypothetical protein [Aquificota bacterium]
MRGLLALIFSLILTLFLTFLEGCAEVVTAQKARLPKDGVYAVLPFENYTETPLAGYRVASIAEGVLRARGYEVVRVWSYDVKEPTKEELEKLKREAQKKARYLVYGTVNEFRYKAGIDGEPAVSVSLFVYDAKEKKVVKGASASATGWSYESVGTVVHELLKKLLR